MSGNYFKHLSQEFNGDLLNKTKKTVSIRIHGQFWKVFFEKQLLDGSKFHSSLKNECVSKKKSLDANNIWNMFRMNTMGDYHDLYLKTNVLLLVDVFEKIISICL